MAAEPINLFSHKVDPAGVLEVLRRLSPDVQITPTGAEWQQATISSRRGFLSKRCTITFKHDPDYYSGPGWLQQMAGMQGYFSRFPENENTPRIMLLIQSFRFALATSFDPELEFGSNDQRLTYLYAVAKHLDAAIFTPSSLRDSSGRILVHASEDPDPRAVMPAIYKEVPATSRAQRQASEGGSIPDPGTTPPSPVRVAARACALAAVAGRALLELEDYAADPGVEKTRQRIVQWVESIDIKDELEPDEWKVLQRPLGSLDQREAVPATWRLEGLGILAWALQRFELLPHDQLVDPGKLLPAVSILNVEGAKALLHQPSLRSTQDLQKLSNRLFAIHWRLRNFSLRPERMNFREFARTAWFGPLDLEGVALADDELALADQRIDEAEPDQFQRALSAAMERHLAINWLNGRSEKYSDTDVST